MAEDQDIGYRLLFSYPRMVEDLIRLFVGGKWVERLDFSTLEKVSERDVSPELVRREKDLLWRLRLRPGKGKPGNGDWFYVFLHLEFQSEPNPFMAVRILTYRALLWEDLIRQKAFTGSGKLPPVLSVVLYTGDRRWTGATSVVDLIESIPDGPEGADPLSFRLIEERSYSASQLDAEASPVMGVFSIEKILDPRELLRELARTGRGVPGRENRPLREAIGSYVLHKLRKLAPDFELPWKIDLLEVHSMLEQRVAEWTEQWKREGLQEGRREGLRKGEAEGRRKGEAAVLLRMLRRRHGLLSPEVEERVRNADAEQLLEWADRFVTASTLEEVFDGTGHD